MVTQKLRAMEAMACAFRPMAGLSTSTLRIYSGNMICWLTRLTAAGRCFFYGRTPTNIWASLINLGPDGRIYAAPYQGFTSALHTIDYPDSPGLACGFKKWGLPIPTGNANEASNMVHFRMGPLVGSGCDTIRTDIKHETLDDRKIRVYPNPARDIVEIDLLSYNYYHPQQQFYLYDLQGRLVKQVPLPYLSAQLNVSDLPAGIYHWRLAVKTEIRGEGKLEVVR